MASKKQIISNDNTKVYLTEKGIVSKNMVQNIRGLIEEDIEIAINVDSLADPSVRENIVHNIMAYFSDLYEESYIDQWDVICDMRNNTPEMQSKGVVSLTVKFKQWNCLNYTLLEYVIETKPKPIKKKSRGRIIL
jgi:hypothetical protein